MKNKAIIKIVSIFFLLIIIRYLFILYSYAVNCDGWVVGDWLINFQAGFVRRGLSGYLIIGLSDILGVKANFMVMAVQALFFIGFILLLYKLIYRKQINIWFLILLFSPVTLLFPIIDIAAAGRKEIILFFLFALYILLLKKDSFRSRFLIYTFSFILLIATLFHELVFFYTPYFLLAAYLKNKIDNKPFVLRKWLLIISGSFFVMFPIFFWGKTIDGAAICADLAGKGLSENICNGVLSFQKPGLINGVNYNANVGFNYANAAEHLFVYGTALILGLLPLLFNIKFLKNSIITLRNFFIVFIFLFLFSALLFLTAVDWGRWINIHFILLLLTFTLLLKDNSSDQMPNWSNEYLILPRLWKTKGHSSVLLNNAVFLVIVLLYLTLWHMEHYGIFSLFYTDVYSSLLHFFK